MIGGAFAVPAVRFSPQGDLLAAVDMKTIRLRDPATARLAQSLRSENSVYAAAFRPDGGALAAAESSASLRLWDLAGGEEIGVWQAHPNGPTAFLWDVAFAPGGDQLAAVSSLGGVFVWSYPQGDPLAAFQGHSGSATAIAFSPDGGRIATGGLDGLVKVWERP
jgi:WD40 repeat protein